MSKTTNPIQDGAYPASQIEKIANDFKFKDTTNLTHPIAPLVSVQLLLPAIDSVYTLITRATLYINSDVPHKPRIKSIKENGTILEIIYKHDFSETTPETCDVWYVEANYSSKTAQNITQVVSYLQGSNKTGTVEGDPPVSRGTRTDPDGDGDF